MNRKLIKKKRLDLKLSQTDVADKVGCSATLISMVERGKYKTINSDLLQALAKLFKMKMEELL